MMVLLHVMTVVNVLDLTSIKMVLNDAWNVAYAVIVWTAINVSYVAFVVIAVNYVKDAEATAA